MSDAKCLQSLSVNRILIIDDDKELCDLIVRFLRAEGFAMERAANARDGIDRALSESYSLIMLDICPTSTGSMCCAESGRGRARRF